MSPASGPSASAGYREPFSPASIQRTSTAGGLEEIGIATVRTFVFATILAFSGTAFAQPASKPTDAQIAHIAYTAGQIDIKAAELARKQTKNKEVRAFANDMLRDHKAVNVQALALVKKLNVTPEDNETSRDPAL